MAKLHSASPREITSPFTHEIISVLHSKVCNRSSETRPPPNHLGLDFHIYMYTYVRTFLIRVRVLVIYDFFFFFFFFFEKRSKMMMMIDKVVMIIMFINTSFMECLLWLKAGFSRHQVYW